MQLRTIATLILALSPAAALCQTPEPSRPRFDVAASVAWFHATYDDGSTYPYSSSYRPRYNSLFAGIGGGYYWTAHVKTDVEVGWTKKEGLYGSVNTNIPGVPYPYLYALHDYRTFRMSIAQSYQFGRNAWVHPFVGAGVDIDRERHDINQPTQTVWIYPGGSIPTPASNRTETTVSATPFFKIGLKAYMSERAFFVTDFKVGTATVWKFGFGVDF